MLVPTGVSQNLLDCMNEVYVRGCERAYLGPTLDKDHICPKPNLAAQPGAGSLVIHIRSGDIMRKDDVKGHYADYGQVHTESYACTITAEKSPGLGNRSAIAEKRNRWQGSLALK